MSVVHEMKPRPSGCVTPSQYLSTGPTTQRPSVPHSKLVHSLGWTPAPPPAVQVPADCSAQSASDEQPTLLLPEQTRHGHSAPAGVSQGRFDSSEVGSEDVFKSISRPPPLMFVAEFGRQSKLVGPNVSCTPLVSQAPLVRPPEHVPSRTPSLMVTSPSHVG